MELDLPNGPWSKLVSGQWGNYPVTIYRNPDKVLLLVLFEKEAEKVKGLLVFMKKILVVDGDLSKFLVSQKRDLTLVEKFSKDYSARFLLVGSSPSYVPYSQAELAKAVKAQYSELGALSKIACDVASTYEVSSKDVKDVPDDVAQIFLGDPFSIFALGVQGAPFGVMMDVASPGMRVQLGVDRLKQPVSVRFDSLNSVLVVGESAEKRLHVLHVLLESALLNNVPCMVFDSTGVFSGLSLPNKDASNFDLFKMTAIPLGFPFKSFELDKGLFVDLSIVSSDLFLSTFALEKSDLALLIKRAYDEKWEKLSSLGDVVLELSNLKEDKEFSRYAINKAIRIIEVIQKTHPSLFAKNLSADITMPYQSPVGKVVYINLFKQPENVQNLVVQSVLQPFYAVRAKRLSTIVCFEKDAKSLPPKVLSGLKDLAKSGFGFAVHSADEEGLQFDSSIKIELVGDEAVVTEKGEKQKRFLARPAYSHCTESKIS